MKYTATGRGYAFKPTSKTIDFSSFSGFAWPNLFSIINLTAKQTIYAVGIRGYGGSLAGYVLTLDYDTTAMGANDVLMFVMDEGNDALNDILAQASPSGPGLNTKDTRQEDIFRMMLTEMQVTNFLLAQIGNISDDIEDIRTSITSSDL